jgi:crotonobetainyl-CoA:carnitine CoA-transferase CaiB-like acyl-CoA transferase
VTGDARSHAPRVGEHTRPVLTDLGYSRDEIQGLIEQAVVFEPT